MKLTAVFVFLVLGQTLAAGPSRWPQSRGPNGSSLAEDVRPLIDFGAENNPLWKAPLPPGHAPPCVRNERVSLRTDKRLNALVRL